MCEVLIILISIINYFYVYVHADKVKTSVGLRSTVTQRNYATVLRSNYATLSISVVTLLA